MTFWEDLRTTVSGTAKKAAKKTEEFADITKKKIDLKSEEDKLDSLYAQVGKLVYIQIRKGEEKQDIIETLFTEIDDKKEKISKLRAEIAKSKKSKICAKCGSEISIDDVFCGKCGEKQD